MNCNTMPKVQQFAIVNTAVVLLQNLWPFKFCCPKIPFYCGKITCGYCLQGVFLL